MSLFRRATQTEERAIWPGYPYPPSYFAGTTSAGVSVTLETYTKNVAAGACVRVLVSTVKKLPIDEVRYQGDVRIPITNQSQIVKQPSGRVSRRAWVAQIMRSFVTAGNVYGDVAAYDQNTTRPTQIETINPNRASWQIVGTEWVPHIDGKPRVLWPLGDLWHKPATDFLVPGQPFALSPVKEAGTSIGTGIAAEDFGARFFGEGAHPTQVLKSSDPNLTREQAEAAKDALIESTRGTRRPLALGAGWDLEQNFVDPKNSQFIELLRFEVEQACRTWGVPPSMVYAAVSGQSVTYANVSQSDLAFLKYSIDNWLVDIEDAWSEMIPAPRVVKFNTSALLRMDEEARWAIHDLRLKNKTTSVNRVLTLEDELPFPDPEFDKPGIPGGPEVPARPEKVAPPAADPTGTAPTGEKPAVGTPPAKRSEGRDMEPMVVTPNITVNMPEQRTTINTSDEMQERAFDMMAARMAAVLERQDPPQVTVNVEPTPVTVNVAAPSVEVQPAQVTVDNTVNVPAAEVRVDAPVTVNMPAEIEKPATFKVTRDSKGQITKVTEE